MVCFLHGLLFIDQNFRRVRWKWFIELSDIDLRWLVDFDQPDHSSICSCSSVTSDVNLGDAAKAESSALGGLSGVHLIRGTEGAGDGVESEPQSGESNHVLGLASLSASFGRVRKLLQSSFVSL